MNLTKIIELIINTYCYNPKLECVNKLFRKKNDKLFSFLKIQYGTIYFYKTLDGERKWCIHILECSHCINIYKHYKFLFVENCNILCKKDNYVIGNITCHHNYRLK